MDLGLEKPAVFCYNFAERNSKQIQNKFNHLKSSRYVQQKNLFQYAAVGPGLDANLVHIYCLWELNEKSNMVDRLGLP